MKKLTLGKLKAKCQALFNEKIRLRDSFGNIFFCISCNEKKDIRYLQAGHFYNVGHYDGLRFDEDNCHGQCNYCNTFLHGNLIQYRDNLLKRIGETRFFELQDRADQYKKNGYKFSRSEIIEKISQLQSDISNLKTTEK